MHTYKRRNSRLRQANQTVHDGYDRLDMIERIVASLFALFRVPTGC